MTALVQDSDRQAHPGVDYSGDRIPMIANAICFVGSLITLDPTGYANRLVAGQPFAGFALMRVEVFDWPAAGGPITAANGDRNVEVVSGRGTATVPYAGGTQAMVAQRVKLYASDDATYTTTANNNTFIGWIIGIKDSANVIIEWNTHDSLEPGIGSHGVVTYPAAASTILTQDLNKIIQAPVTAATTYTLPTAQSCVGQYFTFVNTGGAFALTIQGFNAGAEKIAGAATLVQAATLGKTTTIYSTGIAGAEWIVIANS